MKQSAVEWFYNELKELIKQSELTEMKPSEFDDREDKLLEQGKKMEKQQQSYSEEDMIKFMQFIVSKEELENTSGVSIDTAKYFLNKFKNKFKNK